MQFAFRALFVEAFLAFDALRIFGLGDRRRESDGAIGRSRPGGAALALRKGLVDKNIVGPRENRFIFRDRPFEFADNRKRIDRWLGLLMTPAERIVLADVLVPLASEVIAMMVAISSVTALREALPALVLCIPLRGDCANGR